jgi:hypothetical protein
MALTWMALRELWISFRLLVVLGALLLAGLPVALLPRVMSPDVAGAPPDPLTWLGLTVALALAFAAAMAAATLATERRRGTAGWMATRAVPRSTIALSWFVAYALLLALGLVPAGIVAWLSLEPFLPGGPLALTSSLASTACAGMAAVSGGLLAGAALPRLPAASAAALASGALLLPPVLGQAGWWWLPADGLRILATLDTAARPVADALRAGGLALGIAAVLLVLAVLAFERADL